VARGRRRRHVRHAGQLPAAAAGGVEAYLKKRRGKDAPRGVSWLGLLPQDCPPARASYLLGRRKSRAEGSFAEAHVRHGRRRCRWRRRRRRRRRRVRAQCYLVAATQNLRKLARHASGSDAFPPAATMAAAA